MIGVAKLFEGVANEIPVEVAVSDGEVCQGEDKLACEEMRLNLPRAGLFQESCHLEVGQSDPASFRTLLVSLYEASKLYRHIGDLLRRGPFECFIVC